MKQQMGTRMLVDMPAAGQGLPPLLLSEPEELYIRKMCKSKNRAKDFGSIANPQFLNGLLTADISDIFQFRLNGSSNTAKLVVATAGKAERALEPHWEFREPVPVQVKDGDISLAKELFAGAIHDTSDRGKVLPEAKAFILIVGEGEKRQIYGFTGWHLLYWTWKEQLNHGAVELGANSKTYTVNVDLHDFEI